MKSLLSDHASGRGVSRLCCHFFPFLILIVLSGITSVKPAVNSREPDDEYIVQLSPSLGQNLVNLEKEAIAIHLNTLLGADSLLEVDHLFTNNDSLSYWYLLSNINSQSKSAQSLLSHPQIIYYQNNHVYAVHNTIPDDSLYAEQWYHQRVKAVEAWENYTFDPKIIISVIDTGLDYTHPDLNNSFWINLPEDLNQNGRLDEEDLNGIDDDQNGYIDDVIGWDFTDAPRFADGGDYLDPDNDPMDEFSNGHGTQIIGMIAAQTANKIGIAGLLPGARVMNLRAGTASGFLEEDDVAKAILYAIENGASIINMSFGDVVISKFLKEVIRYAYGRGIILVASAGNSGTSEIHYPAGFAETISVSATDQEDQLAGFSNRGTTVDITAPGVDMIAPKIDGGYNVVQGTSFSAPLVSAAAALLLSIDASYTVEQIRNIIKTTATDLGEKGWDNIFAAGLLDMHALSLVSDASALFINEPLSGTSSAADSIPIIITAEQPDLKYVDLSYGIGENPVQWTYLTENYPYQVINDTLLIFNLIGLPDTSVVLRLQIENWNNKLAEYRSILKIDRSEPDISTVRTIHQFQADINAVLIEFTTDDITTGQLLYRRSNSTHPFLEKNLNYETRNHKVMLDAREITGPVEFYLEVSNLSGLQKTEDNDGELYRFTLGPEIIPTGIYSQLTYTFPAGYALSYVTDFDNDGDHEVVISKYDVNNAFGPIQIYEFNGEQFELQFETDFNAIPRATGDADGDGKSELLVGFGRTSFLLEAEEPFSFPGKVVWADTTEFWASTIDDVDKDGKFELIGRVEKEYKILENTGDDQFIETYSFVNPSAGENNLGPPAVLINDFDEDGLNEFVYGDYDSDVILYENTADNRFEERYVYRLPFSDATSYLTDGRFFSAGRSLVAGTHTDAAESEHEFNAQYWYFDILGASPDNSYKPVQSISISGYSDIREFDSAFTTAHLDSSTEEHLILAPYPHIYLFKSDNDTLRPVWYFNGARTNTLIVHDFDKNGSQELYFNDGQSFIAFEITEAIRPSPPVGFEVYPVDTTAIELHWAVLDAADKYIIYRGISESELFRYDSTTTSLSYLDSLVMPDSIYYYAVQSINYTFSNPLSMLSKVRSAKPNLPPGLDSLIVENDKQLRLYFNEKMQESTLVPSNFVIDSTELYSSSAVPFRNGSALLLSLSGSLEVQRTYTLRIENIRDSDGTLLEAAQRSKTFTFSLMGDVPYIEKWYFDDELNLIIHFNMPMDSSTVLNNQNYQIEPSGSVSRVQAMSANSQIYRYFFSKNTYTGATGVTTYLSFNNLRNIYGRAFVQGKRINLIVTPTSLQELYIYPQPVAQDGEWLMFANIPPLSEIIIYDVHGREVASLREQDQNGGVRWDLKNRSGQKVAAGIYLFFVKSDTQSKRGKFTVVR